MQRSDWDTTWMRVAEAVSCRSACTVSQIGAVVVDQGNRIVATGYNGPPALLRDLIDVSAFGTRPESAVIGGPPATCESSCPRARGERGVTYENCIAIHAEANALLFCDRREREGGTIYITRAICHDCAKLVANSGLRRVVMRVIQDDMHRGPAARAQFLELCGLEVVIWHSGWPLP